jgi:hypothetical protein
LASSCSAQSGIELLKQSFDRRSSVAGSLIQWRTVKSADDLKLMAKVEMDGLGNTRSTILQPLRAQGQVTLDNGTFLSIIQPDQKAFMQMPSLSQKPPALAERLRLIERNYSLTVAKGPEVAGRKTHLIQAKPKSRFLPGRRIYLDARTTYVLRVEMLLEREVESLLDTVSAEFSKGPLPELNLERPSGFSRLVISPSPSFKTVRDAAKKAGLENIMPEQLGMGFAIEKVELSSFVGQKNAIVVRMTDGLLSMTAYQFRDAGKSFSFGDNFKGISRRVGEQMFVFTGEAPEAVILRMADACVGRREGLLPQAELFPVALRYPENGSNQSHESNHLFDKKGRIFTK